MNSAHQTLINFLMENGDLSIETRFSNGNCILVLHEIGSDHSSEAGGSSLADASVKLCRKLRELELLD